nr:unnamed protein product [Digitaria exilis]
MLPVSSLLDTSSSVSASMPPSDGGMGPESMLLPRRTRWSEDDRPSCAGIPPWKELFVASKDSNLAVPQSGRRLPLLEVPEAADGVRQPAGELVVVQCQGLELGEVEELRRELAGEAVVVEQQARQVAELAEGSRDAAGEAVVREVELRQRSAP